MSGSALAGGVFVPKFEPWYKRLMSLVVPQTTVGVDYSNGVDYTAYIKYSVGFKITHEMMVHDVYIDKGKFNDAMAEEWRRGVDKLIYSRHVGS